MPASTRSASFSGSYGSSDHEHEDDQYSDQEDRHDVISHGDARTTNGHTGSATAQQPQPYSDQKHLSYGNGKSGSKPRRPTHFVCFPLVTDASVPQIADGLRRFREITTAPPQLRPSESQRQQRERELETPERESPSDRPAEGELAMSGEREGGASAGLRVIPEAAHRPPGTFHLTIGAMDLSEKGELQRALEVLKSIDYTALLRDSKTKQHQNGASAGGNGTKEVVMDTTRAETSNSSSSTLNANHTTAQNGSSKDKPANGSSSSYHDTVSRIDRAIMQATPNVPAQRNAGHQPQSQPDQTLQNGHGLTPSHSYTNGGMKQKIVYPDGTTINNTTDIYGRSGYKETVSTVDRYVDKGYDMKERMKRRVKHPLRSLKRNVSPPSSVAGRRLLSGDSSRVGSVGGDGLSLRTTTTNNSGGTERPRMESLKEEQTTPSKQVATINGDPKLNHTKPFLVTLKGLGAFQSARKARVFYAPPVDHDGVLQAFANGIRQVFKDEGLVNEDRALTLHATVANMTYAQKSNHHHGRGGKGGKGGKGANRGGAPRTVDGTEVIERFNHGYGGDGYIWAENVVVDRVRICKMGAERSDDELLGMVYPAVEIELDGGERAKAEVIFA